MKESKILVYRDVPGYPGLVLRILPDLTVKKRHRDPDQIFALAQEEEKPDLSTAGIEKVRKYVREDKQEESVSMPEQALQRLMEQGFEFEEREPRLLSPDQATEERTYFEADFQVLIGGNDNVFMSAGDLIVQVNPSVPLQKRRHMLESLGLTIMGQMDTSGIYFQVLKEGEKDVVGLSRELIEYDDILRAFPNLVQPDYEKWTPPNLTNPSYTNSWHLNNTNAGSNTNKFRSDIAAEAAWNRTIGGGERISIIERGFHFGHIDLAPRIVTGADFGTGAFTALTSLVLGTGSMPVRPHGTGTSGIAMAVENNGNGSLGLAHRSGLVFIGYAAGGFAQLRNALLYAIDPATQIMGASASDGADVISMSLGGPNDGSQLPAQNFLDAIKSAGYTGRNGRGVPFFLAVDNHPQPADIAWNTTNLTINITRSSRLDLHQSAAYGRTVDFIAPGSLVWIPYYTGVPSNTYEFRTGTSFATPLTAALAALILSQKHTNPRLGTSDQGTGNTLSWLEVKDIIKRGAIKIGLELPLASPWLDADPRIPGSNPNPIVTNLGELANIHVNSSIDPKPVAPVDPQTDDLTIRVSDNTIFEKGQALMVGARTRVSGIDATRTVLTVNDVRGFSIGQNVVVRTLDTTFLSDHARNVTGGGSTSIPYNSYIEVRDTVGFQAGDTLDIVDSIAGNENVTIQAIHNHTRMFLTGTVSIQHIYTNDIAVRNTTRTANHNATVTAVGANTVTLNNMVPAGHTLARLPVLEILGTEIRYIREDPDGDGHTLHIDSLLNNHDVGDPVLGGGKPVFSPVYGYGRIDAERSVALAMAYSHDERDLMIRNYSGDDGVTPTVPGVNAIHSPDLWIANTLKFEGIHELDYDTEPPHELPAFDPVDAEWGCRIANFTGSVIGLPNNPIGPLDDLHVDDRYRDTGTHTYDVRISATGTPDSFQWRKDGGVWSANVPILDTPQLIDTSVRLQFQQTTGHNGQEQWVINTLRMRFVYVRVRNRGNRFKGLENSVRVSLALSDGTVPVGNQTPFQYPNNFIQSDITNVTPISSVLGASAQDTFFIGEKSLYNVLPTPDGGKALRGGIEPNEDAIVRIGWEAAHIPPVNTPFQLFLLAEIVPHDGAANDTEATNNNNLSYREIVFASFDYMNQARSENLAGKLEVDAFGTSATMNFSIDFKQLVGNFSTEKLKLEVIRVNDNGTEEKAVYHHNGVDWTFEAVNPQWGGLNLTPPIVIVGGVLAAGDQTGVSFQGDFQAAKEHQRVIFRPLIVSRHSDAVIARDEHKIEIVEKGEIPTGISSGDLVAPPPPKSHAFADMANLTQNANHAYGPVQGAENNKFRVTSLFTADADTHAYAVTSGMVFLQPGSDANTVNLVLRPFRQSMIGFTPVKYYIYRGLRKSDFLDAADDTKILAKDDSNSKFIERQWEIHIKQNVDGADFLSKSMGYDPDDPDSQNASDLLDGYFFRSDPDFQLPFASRGMELGRFHHEGGHEFGIEIVLEEGTYEVDLKQVRKASHEVDVSAMPSGTDAEKFNRRLAREEILNFIDPAAFYGMHFSMKGTVETRIQGSTNTEDWQGEDIYSNVVNVFYTRNRVYLDVRNENGDSYNFYGNYEGEIGDSDHGMSLEIGTEYTDFTTNNLAAVAYATEGWPVIIEERVQNVPGDTNMLYCQFRTADNEAPLIYVQSGSPQETSPFNPRFIDDFNLGVSGLAVNEQWTRPVALVLANTGPANAKQNVAAVVKLVYNRAFPFVRDSNWPDTVLKRDSGTDNIFGPLNLTPLWDTDADIRWITAQDKRYLAFQSSHGYMAERGVAIDGFSDSNPDQGRMVLFAVAKDYFLEDTTHLNSRGITGGVSTKGTFFEAADLFRDLKLNFDVLNIGSDTITTLSLTPTGPTGLSPDAVVLLCLSRQEWNTLTVIGDFQAEYPRYAALEMVEDTTDINGKTYKKFKVKVQGLDPDGKYRKADPAADVFVYSVDGYLHFSDNYSKDEPLPTTYNRDAEENIGALTNVVADKNWEDFFIEKDVKGTLNGVSDTAQVLVQNFINDVNAVVNDANARANLAAHIDNHGRDLLGRMRAFAEDNNNDSADDRVLYWSRIKMAVALKSHERLLQSFDDRNDLVRRLEEKTRGYGDIDFSGAPPGTKKVLLTGFDPTFLDPNGGLTHNVLGASPSASTALALHGKVLQDSGGNDVAYVQSIVLPVRYDDFGYHGGEGIVEELFPRFFDPSHSDYEPVDMVIAMDRFLHHSFQFGRFAARIRGMEKDNRFLREPRFPQLPEREDFLEQSLDVQKAVPSATPYVIGEDYYTYFNQTYAYTIDTSGARKAYSNEKREGNDALNDDPENNDPANLLPVNQPSADITPVEGSFPAYFANELFYRLCSLRERLNTSVDVGLLMLPKIQDNKEEAGKDPKITHDFDGPITKEVIDGAREHLVALSE